MFWNEKIHDFGIFGKWSKSTLNAQRIYDEVHNIEQENKNKRNRINKRIEDLEDIPIKPMKKKPNKHSEELITSIGNMRHLRIVLDEIKSLEKERNKINKDYDKYKEVLIELDEGRRW